MIPNVSSSELNVRIMFATRAHFNRHGQEPLDGSQFSRSRYGQAHSYTGQRQLKSVGQLTSMKCVLTVSLLFASGLLAAQPVLSAECTPTQLMAVKAAQQDPAALSACASLIIDPAKPMGLSNLDFCKSEQCRTAIQGIISKLPECEVNGMSISTGTGMVLSTCISGPTAPRPAAGSSLPPPPPGANGLPPPPPGANGLPPPPPGADGLPPPPPGASGLPHLPPGTVDGSSKPPATGDTNPPNGSAPKATTSTTTTTTSTAPSGNKSTTELPQSTATPGMTVRNSTTESKTPQTSSSQATVKPADSGEVDAGDDDKGNAVDTVDGSGSVDVYSGSEDTSINSPGEIDSSQSPMTPASTKPTTTAAAMPTTSPSYVLMSTALALAMI